MHLTAQDDMTALHFAATKGKTDAVQFLLNAGMLKEPLGETAGANVVSTGVKASRKTQRLGNTPLHLAAKGGTWPLCV